MASSELEVKEISELNDVSITDDALALTYTEKDGVGKTSFQNIKKYLGAEISVEQSATSSANGGTNTISVKTRNGETNATKTFSVKNGQGINSIVKTESIDANGLRQNQINITASESKNSVNATIKDGVGIKTHTTTASTDANGLKTNTLAIAYTDGKSNSVAIKDGVGIRQASQTTSSSISGGLNEYTIKLTDGTTTKIQVYNGAAGKDFRIAKTYTSVAAMKADFSGTSVKTYEFAMIDTGSVQDIDTGKLYCKGTTEWTYIGDLSGAQGIKGETGNGISSITNTQNSDGNIDVKITMTNGTSKTFTVLNGINVVAGNGISINDKFVVSISDNLSSLISDIQSLANTNKNDISSMQSALAKIVFPVGFVYTQYSGTSNPATLGLTISDNCAWVDITSKYTGAFFRAYYSSSGSFSDSSISLQSEQLSSHTHTINHEHTASASVSNAKHVYYTGSNGHPSANANVNTDYQLGGNSNTSVSVSVSSYSGSTGTTGSGELRPRNVAIKIWQVQEV